jgi:hypothetical protein
VSAILILTILAAIVANAMIPENKPLRNLRRTNVRMLTNGAEVITENSPAARPREF